MESEHLIARAAKSFPPEVEAAERPAADVADFRERLSAICVALEDEAKLNPVGRACAHGLLTRAIRERFGLGRQWAKNPELAETEIAAPIFVIGQMRSGTTRIHRLLAADPAHAATRFCDSWHSVPQRPDLRPLRGAMTLFLARKLDPWIDSLHPFGAARPDEELGWLASALDHSAYEAQWNIPSFVAMSEARDPVSIYREFDRVLRTDAATQSNAMKPRVMKTPQFAEDLAPLLAQFPDAQLIVSRRNDDEVLRSSVSLVANQKAIQSDLADLGRIETEWKRKLALRSQRMDDALAAFKGPVAEVDFDELGADWEAEIERIYMTLGWPLSDEALHAMRREQKRAATSPHHQHSADLKQFEAAD